MTNKANVIKSRISIFQRILNQYRNNDLLPRMLLLGHEIQTISCTSWDRVSTYKLKSDWANSRTNPRSRGVLIHLFSVNSDPRVVFIQLQQHVPSDSDGYNAGVGKKYIVIHGINIKSVSFVLFFPFSLGPKKVRPVRWKPQITKDVNNRIECYPTKHGLN